MQLVDEKLIDRQIELELESVNMGVDAYRKARLKGSESEVNLPPSITLLNRIMSPYCEAIERFKLSSKRGATVHGKIRRFLSLLPTEDAAYIAAKRIFESIASDEPVQRIAISIADRIHQHVEFLKYKQEAPGHYKKVESNIKTSNQHHRKTVILFAKRKIGINDDVWTEEEKLHIGQKLIFLFIESTGLVQLVQEPSRQRLSGKYRLQATQATLDWLEKQHARCEVLSPYLMPMIVPPRDWTNPYDGGYYTLPFTLIKTRNKEAVKELGQVDMPKVYRAINAVQQTPWRINKKIYDIITQAWKEGGMLGGLPSQHEAPLPPAPWSSDKEFEYMKVNTPEVVKEWKRKAADVYEERISEKSKRIAVVHKLLIAEKFLNEPHIYFCWNLDWRGRMYPIQGHINPQADDLGKSLIEFAESKPLGEEGAFWLKIHLANCYGVDKVSFEERVAWVDTHKDYILDSATNPLDGIRFWAEADSPYLFLAACFEFKGYCDEGTAYQSRIPIALDGSCNGLQNFSALLRDEEGARAVNLVPQEKPNDVYARVAEVLSRFVEKEAQKGVEEARLWIGKIDRDICKRGVMTYVYGAKQYGMKDQILDKLKKKSKGYLEVEDVFPACAYLGKNLYNSIGEVVTAAKEAMNWLQELAKVCSKANIPIRWRTPVGFMPRQEYRETTSKQIQTFWGDIRIDLSLAKDTERLNKRKQTNGIAPNYVHSMDSSHLMLTINDCIDIGITDFAMIHDSYATHACDTGLLSKVLREAFIKQYSVDVLEDLRKEIVDQIEDEELVKEIPPVPAKGNLNLDLVRKSKYFFA